MNDPSIIPTREYFIFVAAPSDVNAERKAVRRFFNELNRTMAKPKWNIRFSVIDWENYTSLGVDRASLLLNKDVIRKYSAQLALVIGIIGQRLGSPATTVTNVTESGTQSEFNGLLELVGTQDCPNIRWFFKRTQHVMIETDYEDDTGDHEERQLRKWLQVKKLKNRCQNTNSPPHDYVDLDSFTKLLEKQLMPWLEQQKDHWVSNSQVSTSLDLISPTFPRNSVSKNSVNQVSTGGSIIQLADFRRAVVTMQRSKSQDRPVQKGILGEQPKALAPYYSWLIDQARNLTISHIDPDENTRHNLELVDLYIELNVIPEVAVLERDSESAMDIMHMLQDNKKVLLMGDPGSGKSTFINHLSLALVQDSAALPGILREKIPVKITLSELVNNDAFRQRPIGDANLIWDVFINNLAKRLDRTIVVKIAERLKFELTQGNLVVLLDGLDEVSDHTDRGSMRRKLIDAVQDIAHRYSENHFILTTRSYAYQPARSVLTDFAVYKLDYFDLVQIENYVHKWYHYLRKHNLVNKAQQEEVAKQLIDNIRAQHSVQALAERPLMLALMADIFNHTNQIPTTREQLYEQSLALLIKRMQD